MATVAGEGSTKGEQERIERTSVQTAQLFQYIDWVSYLVFAFAVFEAAVFVLSGESEQGITSLALLGYGTLLVVARTLAKRGRLAIAVPVLCFGHLAAALAVVPIRPDLAPALIITPFLAVAVALTYTGDNVLRVLVVLAWFVAIAAAYGNGAVEGSEPWPWYGDVFSIASFAVTAAAVLMFLWQFRARLMGMLAKVRAAEERYKLAERGTSDGL